MPRNEIEFIARAAIFRDSTVLLCRNVGAGHFYLPGGHVEFGESAAAAVVRELAEEAGVGIRVGRCALVDEHVFGQAGRRHHEVNVLFHVELADPAAKVVSREPHIEFVWVDLAAVVDLHVLPESHKAWLVAGQSGAVGRDQDDRPEWVSAVPAP